jgi:hypothetical protein
METLGENWVFLLGFYSLYANGEGGWNICGTECGEFVLL